MKNTPSGWAKAIGHGFAHLQNLADDLGDWGLQKMKEVGEQPEPEPKADDNKHVRQLRTFGKKTFKFFGELGDSYYRKYEDLKREKKK